MLHSTKAFAAKSCYALHAWRRHYALHWMEPILELSLNWLDLLLE